MDIDFFFRTTDNIVASPIAVNNICSQVSVTNKTPTMESVSPVFFLNFSIA